MSATSVLSTLPFLVVVGLGLPFLAWSSARALHGPRAASTPLPSARAMAVQVLVLQGLVFGLAFLALVGAQLSVRWTSSFTPVTVLLAASVAAGGLVLAWLEARRPLGARDALRKELRRVPATDPLWLAATIAAALTEELAYRGVLTALLSGPLGLLPAAVVSAGLFGLGHLAQGWRGAIASTAAGLALQAVVHLSGGLVLAVLSHLAYDLGAAWLGRRLARRERGGVGA